MRHICALIRQRLLLSTPGTWYYPGAFTPEMSKPMAEVMKKAILETLVAGLD